jgi:hypothetical protein
METTQEKEPKYTVSTFSKGVDRWLTCIGEGAEAKSLSEQSVLCQTTQTDDLQNAGARSLRRLSMLRQKTQEDESLVI